MSFFDNAKEILIGDKEVALLKIGDKTVYEKSQPVPVTDNIHLIFVDGEGEPLYPYEVRVESINAPPDEGIDETLSVDVDGSVSFYYDIELADFVRIFAPSTAQFSNYKITRDSQYAWEIQDTYGVSIAHGDDLSDIEATITISS